ncbi:MAG: hypothetical protein JEZ02_04710 [Desulfatibacillum sp.]|nr:hypothetical protein [Desulfatibacillum sp.]
MNATLFPYTYMTDDEIQAFNLLFGPPRIYLPSDLEMPPSLRVAHREGLVTLALPLEDQTDRRMLRSVLAECRSWAGTLDLRAVAAQGAREPLTEEAFAANIRASIKRQATSTSKGQEPSPLLADLVFLQMAQALDTQHFDVDLSLRKFQEKENNLFKELAEPGEQDACKPGISLSNSDAPRVRNLPRRLQAWFHLLEGDASPNGLYFTVAGDAMDLLLDKTDPEPLSFYLKDFPWPPVSGEATAQWQEAFSGCMESFITGTGNAAQALQALEALSGIQADSHISGIDLRIALIEENPHAFFSRCLGVDTNQGKTQNVQNTVLVCLEHRAA